ncbi:MAG TPA: hypothetical protein VMZ00_02580 [Sporichthya sp.]|nr:hypothetical protein [Sporichthya sp.]
MSLEVSMRRWFHRMRSSEHTTEPTSASLAQIRIPAQSVGDRMARIPAQRDRRAHTAF